MEAGTLSDDFVTRLQGAVLHDPVVVNEILRVLLPVEFENPPAGEIALCKTLDGCRFAFHNRATAPLRYIIVPFYDGGCSESRA